MAATALVVPPPPTGRIESRSIEKGKSGALLVNAAEGFLVPPRGSLEANAAGEEENTF